MELNSTQAKTPSVAGLGDVQRPGEYLRKIRQSRGLDLDNVAGVLKIPVRQLELLENDDYRALPQAAFVRGYYRAYARFLNADDDMVIQRFENVYSHDTGLTADHELKDSPIKIMGHLQRNRRRGVSGWLKRLLIGLVILGLLGLGWMLLQNWMQKRNAAAATDDVTQVLPMDETANPATAAPAVPQGDRLVLQFSRPTSVMITDATGKTLAQGRQDQNLTLTGETPFSIRLDDAAAVKLQLNNETVDLTSYTRPAGNAEFKLSP